MAFHVLYELPQQRFGNCTQSPGPIIYREYYITESVFIYNCYLTIVGNISYSKYIIYIHSKPSVNPVFPD